MRHSGCVTHGHLGHDVHANKGAQLGAGVQKEGDQDQRRDGEHPARLQHDPYRTAIGVSLPRADILRGAPGPPQSSSDDARQADVDHQVGDPTAQSPSLELTGAQRCAVVPDDDSNCAGSY